MLTPTAQFLQNACNPQWDMGLRDAKRMLENGYAAATLKLTAHDTLSRHPADKYWQGILAYVNTKG